MTRQEAEKELIGQMVGWPDHPFRYRIMAVEEEITAPDGSTGFVVRLSDGGRSRFWTNGPKSEGPANLHNKRSY